MHTSGTGGRAHEDFFFVLPPLYIYLCISPGVCGMEGVQAPLYSRWQRLWYAYKLDGRAGARRGGCVLSPLYFSIYISPGVCGR